MIAKKMMSLCLFMSCSVIAPLSGAALDYPNCKDNPWLNERMQEWITPYLLPINHPIKPNLDAIFSRSRAIENEKTLLDAGFQIIAGPKAASFVVVARHPEVPGYVFKLHFDSDKRCRKGIPHWKWLVKRCSGARKIGKIIKRKGIRHFAVPDKWLYVLPVYPFSSVAKPEPIVLVETDMELENKLVTRQMWLTMVTKRHLDELYSILKHGGYGLTKLPGNVPYTKQGKFVFIDTEDSHGNAHLEIVKKYLSKEMQDYWSKITEK